MQASIPFKVGRSSWQNGGCAYRRYGSQRNSLLDKREILAIAEQTSLNPHVVEKDYILGWVLAGIYRHKDLMESWIFEGGTCLKNRYVPNFCALQFESDQIRPNTHTTLPTTCTSSVRHV